MNHQWSAPLDCNPWRISPFSYPTRASWMPNLLVLLLGVGFGVPVEKAAFAMTEKPLHHDLNHFTMTLTMTFILTVSTVILIFISMSSPFLSMIYHDTHHYSLRFSPFSAIIHHLAQRRLSWGHRSPTFQSGAMKVFALQWEIFWPWFDVRKGVARNMEELVIVGNNWYK